VIGGWQTDVWVPQSFPFPPVVGGLNPRHTLTIVLTVKFDLQLHLDGWVGFLNPAGNSAFSVSLPPFKVEITD
jgi:hypothetical protein